jgi:hypothetical protein
MRELLAVGRALNASATARRPRDRSWSLLFDFVPRDAGTTIQLREFQREDAATGTRLRHSALVVLTYT